MAAAYHIISSVRYGGQSRNFTLADYIQKQCAAYAELLDLKEVTSETKKVDDFLKGIIDPRSKIVK